MPDIQHRNIPEAELHEVRGASTSTAGQILTSTGGASSWAAPSPVAGTLTQGIYDYNDLATSASPIALTSANTQYEMTNDGLGPFTNKAYAVDGIEDVWDVATNRFDFSGLSLGDTVDIRFDFDIDIGNTNTVVDFALELGIGGNPYQLNVIPPTMDFKVIKSYNVVHWTGVYMGDNNTLLNPARLLARSDKTQATVQVNGWYMRVLHSY